MKANEAITRIIQFLKKTNEGFDVDTNQGNIISQAVIYAKRKVGFGGKDFLFFYNLDEVNNSISSLKQIHEQARIYVNGLFKVPKAFRLKVPNIVSVFISTKCIPDELKLWASESTRTFVGGEFHSVYFIDLETNSFYGQGISKTYLMTELSIPYHFEFKKIDPQNRSHYLVAKICDNLFIN